MDFIQYFDDRVLGILYTVTLIGVALTFLLTYSVYKKPYLNQITLGLVLAALGLTMITLRDYVPQLISILVGNTVELMGIFIVYDGMVRMIGRKSHLKAFMAIAMLFMGIHFYYTYMDSNFTARVINFSVFNSFGALYVASHFLVQMLKKFNAIMLTVLTIHVISAAIDAIRVYSTLQTQEMTILFSGTIMLKIFFLYSIFLAIARVVCVMLYNTKDLI